MYTYREIAKEIERRILDGIYPPGTLLPPRLKLMAEFQAARATIDRAVQELVGNGRLTSRRGSGTSVNDFSTYRRKIALIGPAPQSILDQHPGCIAFNARKLLHKSEWNALYKFDGLLWYCPAAELLPVIEAVNGKLPQVVINRTLPGIVCVSTDHRGAYRQITVERLKEHPDALPVFLHSGADTLPEEYRLAGFTDGCRKAGVFYELWKVPVRADFAEKSSWMLKKLNENSGKKLLVFSSSMNLTGAWMKAVAASSRVWKKDLWYSDFDNDYPEHIWGIRITSFLQDYPQLTTAALAKLEMLLDGRELKDSIHQLIFPLRCSGDT